MPARQTKDFFSQFDEWWQGLGAASRASLNEDTARLSFVAGCRVVAKEKPAARTAALRLVMQTYRFRCGRWRITVSAANLEEAKAKALVDLDRRAAKFMTTTPRGGWHLVLVKEHQQ